MLRAVAMELLVGIAHSHRNLRIKFYNFIGKSIPYQRKIFKKYLISFKIF